MSHPKVYSNGGYKVASQKRPIFKAHQDARFPDGRISQQHHLERVHEQRRRTTDYSWQGKHTEEEIKADRMVHISDHNVRLTVLYSISSLAR